MVFILNKVKLGVGLHFLGALQIWVVWAWPKKIPKVHDQKSDFHLQHPDAPRLDFESLKILQRIHFCAYCTILRSNGLYLAKLEKKFQDDIFTKKIHHRPFESYKNSSNHLIGLKICQHTQIEQGFQNYYKTRESERVIFTCSIFSDSRS